MVGALRKKLKDKDGRGWDHPRLKDLKVAVDKFVTTDMWERQNRPGQGLSEEMQKWMDEDLARAKDKDEEEVDEEDEAEPIIEELEPGS